MLKRKSTVTGDRLLISIGYKYDTRNVISSVATKDAGITKDGITYSSKYHVPCYNFSVRPIDRPLAVSKFFVSVNEVDSHNKSRKSDLAL